MSEIAIYHYPLAFKSPDGEVLWDDLHKIFCGCQWMAKLSYGEEQDQKAPRPIALLKTIALEIGVF